MSESTDAAAAAAMLKQAWQAINKADRCIWAAQVEREKARSVEVAREMVEVRIEREAEDKQLKEVKREYKNQYITIPNIGAPDGAPQILSAWASYRMDEGEYVLLWYFTNARYAQAAKSNQSPDELATGPETGTRVTNSKNVVDDQDLSWDDITIASNRMVKYMRQATWPQDRIDMMTKFFSGLKEHPFRSSGEPYEMRALITYQAQVRKEWHYTIGTDQGYNLAMLNEYRLGNIKEDIYSADRRRIDVQLINEVSGTFLSGKVLSTSLTN